MEEMTGDNLPKLSNNGLLEFLIVNTKQLVEMINKVDKKAYGTRKQYVQLIQKVVAAKLDKKKGNRCEFVKGQRVVLTKEIENSLE